MTEMDKGDVVMELTWINPPREIDPVIRIPVNLTNGIIHYRHLLLQKTAQLANVMHMASNNQHIQIILNETPLTSREYDIPLEYLISAKSKLFLNTRYCGSLNLQIINEELNTKREIILDYGVDNIDKLVQNIIENSHANVPEFIYTNTKLLRYPGITTELTGNTNLRDMDQFSKIFVKNKFKDAAEIAVMIQVFSARRKFEFVTFLNLSYTVQKTIEQLKTKTRIYEGNVILRFGENQLDDEKTLSSYDLKHGSHILLFHQYVEDCFFSGNLSSISKPSEGRSMEGIHVNEMCLKSGMPFSNMENPESTYFKNKPSQGLSLKGVCLNVKCKKRDKQQIVPWAAEIFDLKEDSKKMCCPTCATQLTLHSPIFYLTKWKFYGKKFEIVTTNGKAQVEKEERVYPLGEWNIAGEKDKCVVFTVIPTCNVEMTDWDTLVILTQHLPPLDDTKAEIQKRRTKFGCNLAFLKGLFTCSCYFDQPTVYK